ncbi:ABC transporter permease [Saccharothrix deserti]|uniref:ABC transporter permease n=1 Tax=Saccharothrix deserti TaxID=2593674 RepID=UPI00131D5F46|nr:ABC transporter permease [Saccharothrix deserti]
MSARVAVLKAETRLFTREPGTLFWVLVFPPVLLLGFGLIPGYRDADPDFGGRRIIEFYVPGTVLVALITASLQAMPVALASYRERGVLRRMRTTPARPSDLLVAQVVLHSAAALLAAVLVLALGLGMFGVELPRHPLAYLATLALGALAGLAMGAVITAVSRTAKMAGAAGLSVFFPAMFTAGIYVPLPALPGPARQLAELTPFGAAAQALDQAAAGSWPSWNHLVVLTLWTVLLLAAAARWFRWE